MTTQGKAAMAEQTQQDHREVKGARHRRSQRMTTHLLVQTGRGQIASVRRICADANVADVPSAKFTRRFPRAAFVDGDRATLRAEWWARHGQERLARGSMMQPHEAASRVIVPSKCRRRQSALQADRTPWESRGNLRSDATRSPTLGRIREPRDHRRGLS